MDSKWQTYYEKALSIAHRLRPHCERVAIAGGIRRGNVSPKDIDIVCVAKGTEVHDITNEWLSHGVVQKRLKTNGSAIGWGDRFRAMVIDDIPFDLYMTEPSLWGYRLLLSTGDASANHALVKRNSIKSRDGELIVENMPTLAFEEWQVFKACELPYIAPPFRRETSYRYFWQHDIYALWYSAKSETAFRGFLYRDGVWYRNRKLYSVPDNIRRVILRSLYSEWVGVDNFTGVYSGNTLEKIETGL